MRYSVLMCHIILVYEDKRVMAGNRGQQNILMLTLVFIAVATVMVISIVIWLRYQGYSARKKQPGFCCPDLLATLRTSSNFSIDPCRNFYLYTCYNRDRSELSSILEEIKLQKVVIPTFTRAKTAASRTITNYYQECLQETSSMDQDVGPAIEALVRALNSPTVPSPAEMLSFLLRMTLLYKMRPGLYISTTPYKAYIKLQPGSYLNWVKEDQLTHRRKGLKAFNAVTGNAIDLGVLVELAAEAFMTVNRAGKTTTSTPVVLDIILPEVRREEWQGEWIASSGVYIPRTIAASNVTGLVRYFSTLISRPALEGFALLVIEASVESWLGFIKKSKSSVPNAVCSEKAESVGLLWDVVADETFGDPLKEEILGAMYNVIVNRTLSSALGTFPEEDRRIARKALEDTMYLTSNFHFRNITPPVNESGFWKIHLFIKNYERQMRLFHQSLGLPTYNFGTFAGVKVHRNYYSHKIIVPPVFYSILNFTIGVDPLVNMAIIGASIASDLWKLLARQDYSDQTQSAVRAASGCRRKKLSFMLPDLKFSVEVIVNIVKDDEWHNPVDGSFFKASRSKIFYMSYVLYNWCGNNLVSNKVMSGGGFGRTIAAISDFRQTFGCPPDPITTYCYYERQSPK